MMMAKRLMSDPVLVIGGSGPSGRRSAERLAALGGPGRIGFHATDPPFARDDTHARASAPAPWNTADDASETAATDVWNVAGAR